MNKKMSSFYVKYTDTQTSTHTDKHSRTHARTHHTTPHHTTPHHTHTRAHAPRAQRHTQPQRHRHRHRRTFIIRTILFGPVKDRILEFTVLAFTSCLISGISLILLWKLNQMLKQNRSSVDRFQHFFPSPTCLFNVQL